MALSHIDLINKINYIETGVIDWVPIQQAFDNIETALNNIVDETNDQIAFVVRQTFSVSKICEEAGDHVLLNAAKHPRCRIISAYCTVHDNIAEEIHIELVGRSHRVKFSATEKKGSAKELVILTNGAQLHWNDALTVNLSVARRITVHVTFESIEEV